MWSIKRSHDNEYKEKNVVGKIGFSYERQPGNQCVTFSVWKPSLCTNVYFIWQGGSITCIVAGPTMVWLVSRLEIILAVYIKHVALEYII